ncbi:DEAD/DEAH box helicase family protein [Clostridium mediterraneense]|uniref:DEAD/DEAH box helicase family protein n=1 Tax=Clostridium mediterraneense TaxID=1805472 RepID=UPI00082F6DC1|nr:DEAD/DEAH box helicase family protein [Clostridium mediterraneense]
MSITKVKDELIEHKDVKILWRENVSLGGDDRRNHLYSRLKECFKKADKIDIIVSFLMISGVKLIIDDLKSAIDRGVSIRILSGNYLNITQPEALYMLRAEFGNKINLRFYNNKNRSFHPKSYIFHYKNDSEIFIGSSNISRGALTSSIEWNYRFNKNSNKEDFDFFMDEFNNLYNNHSIEVTNEVLHNYAKTWIRPKVYKDLEAIGDFKDEKIIDLFEPRGPQIEILYSLNKSREEGFDKGLVVAATGVGKTYLSAFDSMNYKRVLFIAHREEIIKQAMQSFKNVRQNATSGFFYANNKEKDKDLIFALVQTLGKEEYLNEKYFKRDYFDYIVIDEFHHASSKNYQKIIDYFKPKFLLGLTATPERLDGKDVFAICDYNLVYEVRLKDAINRGALVPFKYYGIYDETIDYEHIEFKNGKYNEKQLEEALNLGERDELIIKHYEKYSSKVAIGFCSSKKHAEHMAEAFNKAKIPALAVYSGEQGKFLEKREIALNKLRSGEIKVLFAVDMFNEGLDVPQIDLVMFLRPTESPTIFLQQLGRGLRKVKGKEYLIVLDFIGNYKKANLAPFLLSGQKYDKIKAKNSKVMEYDYPEECQVDFDFKLVDIFKRMAESQYKIKDLIREEFYRIMEDKQGIPSRIEIFRAMDDSIYINMKSKAKENLFRDYLGYLRDNNLLDEEQKVLIDTRAYDFINMIETTSMSKSYKIPILLAFYNNGNIKTEIDDDDIYISFKSFYLRGSNKVDMLKDKGTSNFENWEKKDYIKLAKNNPVKYLCKSHSDFFEENEEGNMIIKGIEEFKTNKEFIKQMKDAIDLRIEQYYQDRYEKIGKGI